MSPVPALVVLLITQLGDPSFRAREEASVQLVNLGSAAHIPLQLAKISHDDPEVRMRARVILEDWRATFRTTGKIRLPHIDCLPDDYPDRQMIIQESLKAVRGDSTWDYNNELGDWPAYRFATNYFVDRLIANGVSREKIVQLLDQMAERETAFWKRRATTVTYDDDPRTNDQLP